MVSPSVSAIARPRGDETFRSCGCMGGGPPRAASHPGSVRACMVAPVKSPATSSRNGPALTLAIEGPP